MQKKIIFPLLIVLSLLTAGVASINHLNKAPQQDTLSADLNSALVTSEITQETISENATEEISELAPTVTHRKITRNVVKKTLRDHYKKRKLDSELSKISYERYLTMLDGNKQYFLQSDIQEFSAYQDKYLLALTSGKPDLAFDMFKRYQERARNRLQFALDMLDTQPDLSSAEAYIFDREDAAWPVDQLEWDMLWQQRIKNDVINQFLADKDWEKSQKSLKSRYRTALRQVDQQRPNDVFQLFLNAYIDSLDPHSGYFNPRNEDERNIQSSLTYSGIGATLTITDEYVTITNIIPGGPAEETELVKVDDHIIGVGQNAEEIEEVFGWRLDDVVDLIRGPKESKVFLRLIREVAGSGESEIEIELTRNQITLEAQAAQKEIIELERDNQKVKIGLITIPSFYQDYEARRNSDENYKSLTRDVYNHIQDLKTENIQGLVIDLRNNGGGNLEEAVTLTGLFIDEGPITLFRDSRNGVSVYDDPNVLTDIAYSGPLTVLVNRYSASASEIFAAAIQDYERGVVVGQTTFGKGTVQNQIPLDNKIFKNDERFGKLSLTIGKFYRVNGGSTQHRGVIPDIKLPSYIDEEEYGESSEDSALAWDQIKESYFEKTKDISVDLINKLNTLQQQRAAINPDMQFLMHDIAARKILRDTKMLSLNLETRRAEREFNQQQSLQRENERRKALDLEILGDFKSYEDAEPIDIQLDQAKEITADLLTIAPTKLSIHQAETLSNDVLENSL